MNACSCFLAWEVSSIYPTQGIPLGLMTCTLLKMQRYYTQLMKILKLNAKTQAKGQVKRLQAVQNDAACLGLIAVTSGAVFCIFKTAALVWKRIHSVASVYLQEQRTQVDSIHGHLRLRSASTGCIQLPTVQTSVAQRSFAYNGPAAWNCLPATLRDSSVSLQ